MSDLNEVRLCGRLGDDPSERVTSRGDSVVTFSMATSDSWTDKQTGERRQATEWHRIIIYNDGIGKVAMRYLRKGSRCLIGAKVQNRKYEKNGTEHRITEMVMQKFDGFLQLLDGRQDEARQQQEKTSAGPAGTGPGDLDDDVPF